MQKNNLSININGPFRDAGGYSKMNREITKALINNGVKVSVNIAPSNRSCKELSVDDILKKCSPIIDSESFCINGILPQMSGRKNYLKNIILTMMETETLHKDFVNKIKFYGEIFTPCEWNKKSFQDHGVKSPIHVVNLGVDTELYNPNVEPHALYKDIKDRDNKFIFLSLFGWSKRKGYDILLRSFLSSFRNNPDVVLVIASRIWGSEDKSKNRQIIEEIKAYAKAFGHNIIPENIKHIGYGFEEEEMPSLFTGADCFVLPTRGECWGLPLIEAGSCEIPVITTRHGGQLEFLDDNTSFFIETEGVEPCGNLGLHNVSSYYGKDIKIAKLGNAAVEELSSQMTYVVNNYNEALKKSKNLREKIINNFTWDHTAKRIINILGD